MIVSRLLHRATRRLLLQQIIFFAIRPTGVFIMTSSQLWRNGTMKHEAMPDHAPYDVNIPKSIYSDTVISASATPHELVCFYDQVTLFD